MSKKLSILVLLIATILVLSILVPRAEDSTHRSLSYPEVHAILEVRLFNLEQRVSNLEDRIIFLETSLDSLRKAVFWNLEPEPLPNKMWFDKPPTRDVWPVDSVAREEKRK